MYLLKLFQAKNVILLSPLALLALFWAIHFLLNVKCRWSPATVGSSSADDSDIKVPSESVDSSDDVRILVWVLTGTPNHMTKALHVKKTWGKHFDKLLFMSSTKDERVGTIALPGVTEGHGKLWPKTQRAFEYVWEHHKDDADWFMKADDDTFVVSHNLRDFLKDFNPNEPHYFGKSIKWWDVPVPVNYGGTGYILSKAAVKLLIEAFQRGGDCHTEIRKVYKGDEDTEMGLCLASMNVTAEDANDAEGKHRMVIVWRGHSFNDIIVNFNGTWPEAQYSSKVLSFHSVSPVQMYLLEQLAYKMKMF